MGVSGAAGVAGALLAAEVLAPLLLLCGLCCWPMDSSDSSSNASTGKHPSKPVVAQESGHHRRRSTDLFSRRAASSATSLHLPGTSGHSKQSLAAYRSHEEIPCRRRSHRGADDKGAEYEDSRYHSAPSVIDEVLHRRDWERSSKDLYIPLRPERDASGIVSDESAASTPLAPRAEPELSSVECLQSSERLSVSIPCKKHHTNIKSSRNRTKKESNQSDVKDIDDATETSSTKSNFYIGETRTDDSMLSRETAMQRDRQNQIVQTKIDNEEKIKSVYKAKDAKQTFNESIKTKEHPRFRTIDDQGNVVTSREGYHVRTLDIDLDLYVDELDRDGAMHHSGSQSSLLTCLSRAGQFPPSSVEAVGYEGGACYLAESGSLAAPTQPILPAGRVAELASSLMRARHASDGDILAPTLRPESGAFSESDLELELAGCEERPPAYHELRHCAGGRRETAI